MSSTASRTSIKSQQDPSKLTGWRLLLGSATGLLIIFFSFQFISDPSGIAELFGYTITSSGSLHEATRVFIAASGLRNLSFGIAVLVFVILRDTRAVGILQLAATVIAGRDTIITILHANESVRLLPVHIVATLAWPTLGYLTLTGLSRAQATVKRE